MGWIGVGLGVIGICLACLFLVLLPRDFQVNQLRPVIRLVVLIVPPDAWGSRPSRRTRMTVQSPPDEAQPESRNWLIIVAAVIVFAVMLACLLFSLSRYLRDYTFKLAPCPGLV
jgi:hypothetical protein